MGRFIQVNPIFKAPQMCAEITLLSPVASLIDLSIKSNLFPEQRRRTPPKATGADHEFTMQIRRIPENAGTSIGECAGAARA